jgi:hypothetical protein
VASTHRRMGTGLGNALPEVARPASSLTDVRRVSGVRGRLDKLEEGSWGAAPMRPTPAPRRLRGLRLALGTSEHE